MWSARVKATSTILARAHSHAIKQGKTNGIWEQCPPDDRSNAWNSVRQVRMWMWDTQKYYKSDKQVISLIYIWWVLTGRNSCPQLLMWAGHTKVVVRSWLFMLL
jgi:hypothetical protein